LYLPFRYSSDIEKQLLWYLLVSQIFSQRYEQILDIGCGNGDNIKLMRFKKYTGLEIDKKRISINNKKYNSKNYKFIYHDITKKSFKSDYIYDLVLMIQVLTNSLFVKEKLFESIKHLIKSSSSKFIFNTSRKNVKELNKIDALLKSKKINYKKINYGVPLIFRKFKFPILNQIISFIFFIGIFLKLSFYKDDKVIYICSKK
tara:strand:+ start:21869 stop:22474 length:606 start_codon:yes stop_codon:yes gene_type:complete